MEAHLRPNIAVLGAFRVILPGGFEVRFDSKLARALLAYLSVHPHTAFSRNALASTLWSDDAPEDARRKLSQTLWKLRRSMNGNLPLRLERDTVQLDTARVNLDLSTALGLLGEDRLPLDMTLEPAHVAQLTALSTTVLLEGMSDEWVFAAREQWQARLQAELQRLEVFAERNGALEDAYRLAVAQAELEPLDERAQLAAMRTSLLLGREADALVRYERHKAALLGIGERPSKQVRAIRDRISDGRGLTTSGEGMSVWVMDLTPLERGQTLSLVGRNTEREQFLGVLEAARAGVGTTVLLEGELGIGKTKFLQVIRDDASWRNFEVLESNAHEAASTIPYAALRMALGCLGHLRLDLLLEHIGEPWGVALRSMLNARASSVHDLQPERDGEALLRALEAVARLKPMLLVVDDAQWLDEPGARLVTALSARLNALGAIVVLAYRPLEARECAAVWASIEALDRHEGTQRLKLEGLEPSASERLAALALGEHAQTAAMGAAASALARGNPLFLLEALRAMLAHGTRGDTDLTNVSLSHNVRALINAQLAPLIAPDRAALEAAAVLGDAFSLEVLTQVTVQARGVTLEQLEALVRTGFLVDRGDEFAFRHGEIRRAIYEQILPEQRRVWHRRALEVLRVVEDGDMHALIAHASASGDAATEHRLRYTASVEASKHFNSSAVIALVEPIGLAGVPAGLEPDEYDTLLEDCARAHTLLGDVAGKQRTYAALEQHGSTAAMRFKGRLHLLSNRSHLEPPMTLLQPALDLVRQAREIGADQHALALVLAAQMVWADPSAAPKALEMLETAISLAEHGGTARTQAQANLTLGTLLLERGELTGAARYFEQSLALNESIAFAPGTAEALQKLSVIAAYSGDWPRMEALIVESNAHFRRIGYRKAVAFNNTNLAYIEINVRRNRLRAAALYAEVAEIMREVGNPNVEAISRSTHAMLEDHAVPPEVTLDRLHAAIEIAARIGVPEELPTCQFHLAMFTLSIGDLESAERWAMTALDCCQTHGFAQFEPRAWRGASSVAYQGGRYDEALTRVQAGLVASECAGLPDEVSELRTLHAHVLVALGRDQAALEAADLAIEQNQGQEQPYAAQFARHLALERLGRGVEAHAALELSLQAWQSELQTYEPEHRATIQARDPVALQMLAHVAEHFARRENARLARAEAPTGRRLRPDEFVTVDWTPQHADDERIADKGARRRAQLLRLTREAAQMGAMPTLEDLSEALNVSIATLKRDLVALRSSGETVVTRGSR